MFMPFQFGLLDSSNPPQYISVAAYIFREVVRDLDLALIYGHVDDQADQADQAEQQPLAGPGPGRSRRVGGGLNGVDLRWLSSLGSAHLTCSVVKQAQEDRSLRIVKVADMYLAAGFHSDLDITDQDIDVS